MSPPSQRSVASAVEALGRELEEPGARHSAAAARTRGTHRGERRGPSEMDANGAARGVADLNLDAIEREPELLRGDHPHRRARAQSRCPASAVDGVHATVGAKPDPSVPGAPPPPSRIWLTRPTPRFQASSERARTSVRQARYRSARRYHSVRLFPENGGRPTGPHWHRSAAAPRVGRGRLGRELVEQALERPGPLDEAGRAKNGHPQEVRLRAVLDRPDVHQAWRSCIGPAVDGNQPVHPSAQEYSPPRAVGTRRPAHRSHALARSVEVATDDVSPRAGELRRLTSPSPSASRARPKEDVVADAGLGAEAAAHDSQIARTLSCGRPRASARSRRMPQMSWVET